MGNVLDKTKQEQVIAPGRLGWSLRRIEQATGVRRETAGSYIRSAEVALRAPGWGGKPAKPAIEVTTGSGGPIPDNESKPANEVITGFLPSGAPPATDRNQTASACEVYRETILQELSLGRNALGIW